ncbi:Phosphorylated CTD interacting factor 1 WW domain containing protein [Novymonas esmeraldas]|uniref:Phosphorylated CTD interacting factor 1 WW domain containing protein n=1 Tax=Novymonas esmeraldas TaxID=1808958 RepID=A0AAW0EV51_9TRYP
MHVRATRDGVVETFERDRVAQIMQQALADRYPVPPSTPASSPCEAERLDSGTAPGTATAAALLSSHRLTSPQHYTLRRGSRTEHILHSSAQLSISAAAPCSVASAASDGVPLSGLSDAAGAVAAAVACECVRHRAFTALTGVDVSRLCGAADRPRSHTAPLVSRQELCEMPPRWVMQSLGEVDQRTFCDASAWQCRRRVTPLDVGATVVRVSTMTAPSAADGGQTATVAESCCGGAVASPPCALSHPQPRWRVRATAPMARGEYWVEVAPVDAPESASAACERVDRDAVRLDPPARLYVDALLPCDELCSDRGVLTSTYVFFLRALQERLRQERVSGRISSASRLTDVAGGGGAREADLPAVATALAVQLSQCTRQRRAELARRVEAIAVTPPCVSVQVRVDHARECVQLRAFVSGSAVVPGVGAEAEGVDEVAPLPAGPRKRTRDGAREAERVAGAATDNSAGPPAAESAPSPTVEVLLRSAWKLAALYDMAHTATLHGAATAALQSVVDAPPRGATCLSCWYTVVLHDGECALDAPPHPPPAGSEAVSVPQACACHVDHDLGCADGDAAATTAPAAAAAGLAFLGRLYTLLLRYRSLGGELGYNQGPQAAVPPPVMERLAITFAIDAEAFASPLNAHLPQFASLFPDTDVHFGSLGSFFDLHLGGDGAADGGSARGCHVEVNPPFDATLLRRMEVHLLSCLRRAQDASQSLLFVVVLPSHDRTDSERDKDANPTATPAAVRRQPTTSTAAARRLGNGLAVSAGASAPALPPPPPSTERVLRESAYCLGHVLCAAAESAYVDGHQHLLQCPFFTIETPTRLIVLGNTAARERFPDAMAQLEAVRVAWRALTESALRHSR